MSFSCAGIKRAEARFRIKTSFNIGLVILQTTTPFTPGFRPNRGPPPPPGGAAGSRHLQGAHMQMVLLQGPRVCLAARGYCNDHIRLNLILFYREQEVMASSRAGNEGPDAAMEAGPQTAVFPAR
ncbi:hypothetical protein EYF80_053163 [Liparis tanakae]|uniref:Uncharacterized protein n=1 Tax=Liparis tanakae TaxID=230148 RepID=A0A4Z2F5Y8_9TELE|nr:hypothetical protein EYF80_053163 [Liparis tanakae]